MEGKELKIEKIVDLLFEVGTLKNIFRSDRQVLHTENSTVAAHSFRCMLIGYILAKMERVDEDRVIKMCLLHDCETRVGDANFVNKFYVSQEIQKAYKDQLKNLPFGKEIEALLDEFFRGSSKEAIVARDAYILEQILTKEK